MKYFYLEINNAYEIAKIILERELIYEPEVEPHIGILGGLVQDDSIRIRILPQEDCLIVLIYDELNEKAKVNYEKIKSLIEECSNSKVIENANWNKIKDILDDAIDKAVYNEIYVNELYEKCINNRNKADLRAITP